MNDSRLESDPRVYFAAERTLLACIQTELTLMGFGFVVARFGLFLTMVQQTGPRYTRALDRGRRVAGIVGATTVAVSTIQHTRFIATFEGAKKSRVFTNTRDRYVAET